MAYIDVRSVWPVYVRGMVAIEMQGHSRDITVAVAELILISQNKI